VTSINTNVSAMQALQSLRAASAQMAISQKRISTGLVVVSTKDDSATYARAQTLRGDAGAWKSLDNGIARGRSILDVAVSGAEQIGDLVNTFQAKALDLAGSSDQASRDAITADMKALIQQIDTTANSASFDGVNLLRGNPTLNTVTRTTYSLPGSTMGLPSGPTMASLPVGAALYDQSTSKNSLPPSALTPASFKAALATFNGDDAYTKTIAGGSVAGRVVLSVDAQEVPDEIEIWQGGTRVAASGQSPAANGAPVGAAAMVAGQQLLQFDYDPSRGSSFEVRINPNGAEAGTKWSVDALELEDPAAPTPALQPVYQSRTQLLSAAASVPGQTSIDPEQQMQAQNTTLSSTGTEYTRNLGGQAGRVDMVFDAFGDADSMEIWQNGSRIAATGQLSGQRLVSFAYDPTKGDVTFKFNPDGADPASAWAVTAMSISPLGSAAAAPIVGSVSTDEPGDSPIHYDFGTSPSESSRVSTRGLDAAGLGLGTINWSSPSSIQDAAKSAQATVKKALSYFGTQYRSFDMKEQFASRMQDSIEGAVGALVDADLDKESAKLKAAQVRQQLGMSALASANSQPSWLVSLFNR
jgi:flagellin